MRICFLSVFLVLFTVVRSSAASIVRVNILVWVERRESTMGWGEVLT